MDQFTSQRPRTFLIIISLLYFQIVKMEEDVHLEFSSLALFQISHNCSRSHNIQQVILPMTLTHE